MAMPNDAAAVRALEAFGRIGTAMITPFDESGAVDLAAAERVAAHLVDLGNDMLVVSGTTGESPTTTAEEKGELLRTVISAVGDRAKIVAGVGTNVTATSIELARDAEAAGADGLLVVTPYYSKPPQDAIAAHCEAIADAADLPVMLYDIPGRSSVPMEPQTLARLGEHPRILAVKDAKGDLASTLEVMRTTSLAYYSGEDALNLPFLALGAVGVVSVVGHVAADRISSMADAIEAEDLARARLVAAELSPLVGAIMDHMPGVVSAKAALELQDVISTGTVRQPLLPATEQQRDFVREALRRSDYLT